MLTAMLDALTRTPRRALATAAAATVVAALPAAAHAHGLRFDVVVPVTPVVVDPGPACPPPVAYAPQPTQVWVEPVYRTVCDRQWVEPAVQTVTTRVWVPAVTTSATQRVFVPDQFGWRTVLAYDGWGRPYRARQWVLVAPGHYEDQVANVVVTPGHYEDVPQQQVVSEGHWTTVERQELVTPGHWETQVAAVAVPACPPPEPRPVFRVRLPF
jgi:hypothetical protein